MAAHLRDLSVQGLGILTGCWFAPGTLIRIQFFDSTRKASHVLPAEVKHATELADGRWFLGCFLLRLLSVDEVSGLG
jgi:hypothetical protein